MKPKAYALSMLTQTAVRTCIALITLGLPGLSGWAQVEPAKDGPAPMSPQESLRSFDLRDGFAMTLIASEPSSRNLLGSAGMRRLDSMSVSCMATTSRASMTSRHSTKRGSWIARFVAFRPMRWPRKRPSRASMGSSSVCATAMEMGPWMRPWCLPMDYHPVSAWWRQEAASSSHVPPTLCILATVMRTVSPTDGKFCSQVSKKGGFGAAHCRSAMGPGSLDLCRWRRTRQPHYRSPSSWSCRSGTLGLSDSSRRQRHRAGRRKHFHLRSYLHGRRGPISTGTPDTLLPFPALPYPQSTDLSIPSLERNAAAYQETYPISKPHPWRSRRYDDPGFSKYYTDRYGKAESLQMGISPLPVLLSSIGTACIQRSITAAIFPVNPRRTSSITQPFNGRAPTSDSNVVGPKPPL